MHAIELAVGQEGGEERAERFLGAIAADHRHLVECTRGVIDHAGVGVELDDPDPEALGFRRRRACERFLVLEDAFDEIGAAETGELADGEVEDGSIAAETGESDDFWKISAIFSGSDSDRMLDLIVRRGIEGFSDEREEREEKSFRAMAILGFLRNAAIEGEDGK